MRDITSPANDTIKSIKALQLRKYRAETGLYICEGLRSVREGLELGAPLKTLVVSDAVQDRADIKDVLKQAEQVKADCIRVPDSIMEKLARKDNPQSVMAVFAQVFTTLSAVQLQPNVCWVVLEQVRDPGNLGTIIRTIDAVGATGVVLLDQCCDPYSVESTRATMGSLFCVPIVKATMSEFSAHVKNWTGDILGTTLQPDSVDIGTVKPNKPFMLVMGNEQAGLTAPARALCTKLVKLPMRGRADSLNLSVATGVCLYQLL